MQMVLTPNDLFSWNNKYSKYTIILSRLYTSAQSHSSSSSCAHQLTLCLLAFWSCEGVVFLVHSSSSHFTVSHVFPLPLSGANWHSLSLLWGSGPPLPKMAPPSTGSAHTPFLGSKTGTLTECPSDILTRTERPLNVCSTVTERPRWQLASKWTDCSSTPKKPKKWAKCL
jgi:hypothetical protein